MKKRKPNIKSPQYTSPKKSTLSVYQLVDSAMQSGMNDLETWVYMYRLLTYPGDTLEGDVPAQFPAE